MPIRGVGRFARAFRIFRGPRAGTEDADFCPINPRKGVINRSQFHAGHVSGPETLVNFPCDGAINEGPLMNFSAGNPVDQLTESPSNLSGRCSDLRPVIPEPPLTRRIKSPCLPPRPPPSTSSFARCSACPPCHGSRPLCVASINNPRKFIMTITIKIVTQ